jgi:hypothetical protein
MREDRCTVWFLCSGSATTRKSLELWRRRSRIAIEDALSCTADSRLADRSVH